MTTSRVREFARRLVYVEAPQVLSESEIAAMDEWIRERVPTDDTTVLWSTVPKALQETDEFLAAPILTLLRPRAKALARAFARRKPLRD